jgi:hypothetical protein
VGIISGSVARAAIGTLKTIRGVAEVELRKNYRRSLSSFVGFEKSGSQTHSRYW